MIIFLLIIIAFIASKLLG